MTEEQIKSISDKIINGTATDAEKLQLLQELNKGVEILRALIKNNQ